MSVGMGRNRVQVPSSQVYYFLEKKKNPGISQTNDYRSSSKGAKILILI